MHSATYNTTLIFDMHVDILILLIIIINMLHILL